MMVFVHPCCCVPRCCGREGTSWISRGRPGRQSRRGLVFQYAFLGMMKNELATNKSQFVWPGVSLIVCHSGSRLEMRFWGWCNGQPRVSPTTDMNMHMQPHFLAEYRTYTLSPNRQLYHFLYSMTVIHSHASLFLQANPSLGGRVIYLPSRMITTRTSTSILPNMDELSMINPQPCQKESIFRNRERGEHGKPSLLKSYCESTIRYGGNEAECIWLCMQHGRKWIAKDIKFNRETPSLGIQQLRMQYGWLKRHSLFSAVGVKVVQVRENSILAGSETKQDTNCLHQIRFLGFREASNDFEVVLIDLDSTGTSRKIERELDAMDAIVDLGECGIDVMGRSHDPNIFCPNEDFDQYSNEIYCKVQNARRLKQQKVESKWLQPMLEFYWQNGIGTQAADFLRANGFLVSYE